MLFDADGEEVDGNQILAAINERSTIIAERDMLRELLGAVRFGTKLYLDCGIISKISYSEKGQWKAWLKGSKESDDVFETALEAFAAIQQAQEGNSDAPEQGGDA